MMYLSGIFIAVASLIAATIHLDQTIMSYYDFVGFVVVLGGTISVMMITLPWQMRKEMWFRVKELVKRSEINRNQLLKDCMAVNQDVAVGLFRQPPAHPQLPYQILRDGVELIQLGMSPDKIEAILKERLYQTTERGKAVSNAIRGLSKYPPAFGLAGTVLGLVHLMRGVSAGMNPQETGIRMAIALVATFYGLLVANMIVNPIGDAVAKNAHDDEKLGEIALQTILLAAERTNLLESQEMLNSYVEPHERVSVINFTSAEESPEVAA